MKLCPVCHRCYEDTLSSCANDQTALVASRPGSRMIADKYRLDSLLGRGGMGAVYAGTHVDLDRPVAIKLLLSDFTADADALERFRREARAAARLNHPNVADTYDYGLLPDGGAYIVMELVEGQTLREYMDAAGALSVAEAAEIGRQVAAGVDLAHRSGIVHRDLKPSNIILTRDHRGGLQAKVVDFGVAKLKEYSTTGGGLTSSGSLIGTPRYMSPEQCSGHQADARSDIYSMGVILYEMLAGRPPFDAPSATAIAIKHIQQPPPSLKESRPDAAAELDSFLRRVLDKDPDKRPQTAAEFSSMLDDAARAPAAPATVGAVLPEVREQSSPTAGPPTGRETNAFATLAGETERAGGPTLEHPSIPARFDDPSVRAFGEAVAAPAELLTEAAEPAARVNETVESEPVIEPATHTTPPAVERRETTDEHRPASHKTFIIVAASVFLLGFIVVAYWLTRSGPPETISNNGTQPTANSPANQTPSATNAGPRNDNAQGATPRDARAELSASLTEWVAATNGRDINKLMAFYAPTVSVFYQRRNSARAAVRVEKNRLLEQASQIDVRVGEPETEVSADGRTATMRFRKSWVFNGVSPRSGEVIQELRWEKMDAGWQIVSERDVQVISVTR